MKLNRIVLLITIGLVLLNCSNPPFIPISEAVIDKYGITHKEFNKLQYYSDKNRPLVYKATTLVVKDTSIERSGTLSQQQLTARYSYDIYSLTPGILIDYKFDLQGVPTEFFVKFDTSSTPLRYIRMKKPGASTSPEYFRLVNQPFFYKDKSYRLDRGLYSVLYIKMSELDEMIINRDQARGIRVTD